MSLSNNPVTGASYFLRGLPIILRPRLRRFVVIPLAVNIVLFAGLIWFGSDWVGDQVQSRLPASLDWLSWILVPLFVFVALVISAFLFNMVANLIASPFNGLLAEAVEMELTGRRLSGDSSLSQLLAEVGHTFASEIRKLLYIIGWSIPMLFLMLLPFVNIIGSFLWVVFGAWMLAVAYVDYPMGNHGLRFAAQRARLRTRRWAALGFGGAAMFIIAIPILNFVVVPWAVAGATLFWVEQLADEPPGDLTD